MIVLPVAAALIVGCARSSESHSAPPADAGGTVPGSPTLTDETPDAAEDDASAATGNGISTEAAEYVPPPQIDDANPVRYADRKVVFDIQELLVQNCMAESGFRYAISRYPPEQREQPPLVLERIPSEGYQQSVEGSIVDPALSGDEGLPGYTDAADQCFGRAFERMYGEPRQFEEVNGDRYSVASTVDEKFRELPGADPWASTVADQRYVDLLSAWSACVGQRGVDAATIEELAVRFSERQPDRRPEQAEVDAATADFHCRSETSYYAIVADIQQGYVDEWMSANAAAIDELTAAADEESERLVALAQELGIDR